MKRLKLMRLMRGIPMEVLAHQAGVSTRAIYMIERWGIPPRRRETLEKIAQVLGVDADELLQDVDPSDILPEPSPSK